MCGRGEALDWAIRARRSDFHLSPASPIWANVGSYAAPTPLDIDIHAGLEVGIMLAGRAERHFEDYVVPGVPGDVWLCAMWEPHGWKVMLPDTERVVLVFLPDFIPEETFGDLPWLHLFAVPPAQRPRATTPEVRETALAVGRRLRAEIQSRRQGWKTAVRLDLLRLLFALGRDWSPPAHPRRGPARAGSLSRIMPALTLLHERSPEGCSLEEAAAACGLHRSRFANLFRDTMGITYGRFRLRSRLAFAAHLLLSSDLSSHETAAEAGFADASHFHRAFVKHYGRTPGRYREQHTMRRGPR